jgi:general secretion pathway protein D
MQLVTTGNGGTQGGGGGGGAAGGATPFKIETTTGASPTVASISQMIHDRVRPESWDPALGTSIDEKAGKLVVMQRPEVHELIDQLLSNFRATQKLMVNIEARFLELRESYLEDIGVELQGLDPNVLMGDFGDVSALGPYVQPRQAGEFSATPANVYYPGMVTQPVNALGGTLGTVGVMVNHVIDFATQDQNTISALDANGSGNVIQGGLSGQITLLNNTQMNAFIKALAARENQTTLTAPRLTVYNTQRANMFVCTQQSYVAEYNIVGDMYEPVVKQFMVGVVLDVKPIVSSDRHYVTLEMRPTTATLLNFTTINLESIQIITSATVAAIIPIALPIQFPDIQIDRVRTTVTVPDGGVMVLSGLYNCTRFFAENGVPFLSDLPVVGRLFRWNSIETAKDSLAILVSPKIILFSEEEEKL